jgi:hypothetical protein
MDKNQKLLIIERGESAGPGRLTPKLERSKILNAVVAAGGKIKHDSGGRLVLVEMPKKAETALAKEVTGIKVVTADTDVTKAVKKMDTTEALFAAALKIRTSPAYRKAKAKRKFGDTPEEQAVLTGSCVREEL